MFDVRQFFLSLLSFILLQHGDFIAPRQQSAHGNKSVAVVGGGSAGLAMLRVLVDLQDELDTNLDFVLYEQRQDVGGIWCDTFLLLIGFRHLSTSTTQAPRPTTRPPAHPSRDTVVPPPPYQHARAHDDLSRFSVSAWNPPVSQS